MMGVGGQNHVDSASVKDPVDSCCADIHENGHFQLIERFGHRLAGIIAVPKATFILTFCLDFGDACVNLLDSGLLLGELLQEFAL